MPVHPRRTRLYDYLHELQDLLQSNGIDAQVPVNYDAITTVEH